eukprot:TRINITY_DN3036_c0_g1_i1.p1 TRINITY_DN3036_c0_g1~~TRINITY_DN3036_c0_g1_i1.p1  ORF type:complete len:992 (-),score=235.15 TRINITY_DN3036_c0_g1_i1:37-3012(-)
MTSLFGLTHNKDKENGETLEQLWAKTQHKLIGCITSLDFTEGDDHTFFTFSAKTSPPPKKPKDNFGFRTTNNSTPENQLPVFFFLDFSLEHPLNSLLQIEVITSPKKKFKSKSQSIYIFTLGKVENFQNGSIHNLSLPLLKVTEKGVTLPSTVGTAKLRLYYSFSPEIKIPGLGVPVYNDYEYYYERYWSGFKTGDVIGFSGEGLINSIIKADSGSVITHLGVLVKLPNRWISQCEEMYVVEFTRNLDKAHDNYKLEVGSGINIFKLQERIHGYFGQPQMYYFPLKKAMSDKSEAALKNYIVASHAENNKITLVEHPLVNLVSSHNIQMQPASAPNPNVNGNLILNMTYATPNYSAPPLPSAGLRNFLSNRLGGLNVNYEKPESWVDFYSHIYVYNCLYAAGVFIQSYESFANSVNHGNPNPIDVIRYNSLAFETRGYEIRLGRDVKPTESGANILPDNNPESNTAQNPAGASNIEGSNPQIPNPGSAESAAPRRGTLHEPSPRKDDVSGPSSAFSSSEDIATTAHRAAPKRGHKRSTSAVGAVSAAAAGTASLAHNLVTAPGNKIFNSGIQRSGKPAQSSRGTSSESLRNPQPPSQTAALLSNSGKETITTSQDRKDKMMKLSHNFGTSRKALHNMGIENDGTNPNLSGLEGQEQIVERMRDPKYGTPVATMDVKIGLSLHKKCFLGCDAVDWMIKYKVVENNDRKSAVALGNELILGNKIHHTDRRSLFADEMELYQFTGFEQSSSFYGEIPNIFGGVSLRDIMERQRIDTPDNKVPKIMDVLIKSILDLKGDETEGIFRVPTSFKDLASGKESLNQGNYGIVKTFTDPHLPACLFKLWLRELSESLVPSQQFYQEAVAAGKEDSREARDRLMAKIPEDNRRVIERLLDLVERLTRPESVAKTKMDVDNLSLIFAPALLRCPSSDPLVVMEGLEGETQFTRSMVLDRVRSAQAAAANSNNNPTTTTTSNSGSSVSSSGTVTPPQSAVAQ